MKNPRSTPHGGASSSGNADLVDADKDLRQPLVIAAEVLDRWMEHGPGCDDPKCPGPTIAALDDLKQRIAAALTRVKGANELDPVTVNALGCAVERCSEPPKFRGLCNAHHNKLRRKEEISTTVPLPPGDPKPMVVALGPGDDRIHRKTACPAYNACLMFTVKKGWPGFSCAGCNGPKAPQ